MTKQVSKQAPSIATIEAMPRKTRAGGSGKAKPTMNPPTKGNGSDVQSELGGLSKLELIALDVNRSWEAVQEFESKVQGGRVGPKGTWTELVRRFVHSSKDWKEIRDSFAATLRSRVQREIEQQNEKPSGVTDEDYKVMVLTMVKARMSSPSIRVTLSNFDVIGKFFRAETTRDGKKIPAGPGRDRLLELLEGKGKDKVTFVGTLRDLRTAIGPDGRGRKAGTPNADKAKGAEAQGKADDAPSVEEIETNPALARTQARMATVKQACYFIQSVHPEMEFLGPVLLALGNKCKESQDVDIAALGAMLVDAAFEQTDESEDDADEAAA